MAERMDKLQLTDGMIVAVRSGGGSRSEYNCSQNNCVFSGMKNPCNVAEISRPLPGSRALKLTIILCQLCQLFYSEREWSNSAYIILLSFLRSISC